ncbi:hypothetical protein ACVCAH_34130 [Micromonospora sp. LZ34]
MAEFDELRGELSALRRRLDQQRQEALLAREAVRQAERAAAEAVRTEGPPAEGEPGRHEEELRAARAGAERAAAGLAELTAVEDELLKRFEPATDPRGAITQWPARYPVLLLPLRVETRFGTGPAGQPQLWVRVYPDVCLVDSFEPALSTQEVDNARAFWAAIWRAGGDEAMERTAWRDLVAAHGSGRAGWIVRSYQPPNPLDKPERSDPAEVLLVIVAADPLPSAAAEYWETAWRAAGNPAALEEAYTALADAAGEATAGQIVETYRPVNFGDPPAASHTRATAPVRVAVLRLTAPDQVPTRRRSWSSPARVDLLPERFVLVGYGASGDPLVVTGSPVRTPLIVSPDPDAPPDQQFKPDDDTVQIPDQLAWMFDFDKAVDAGMAFRIDLNPQQAAAGFTRLVVLGVRLVDSPADGREHLEVLLEHHLYSRSGLQIVPQGTPTNNTEKAGAGYSFRDDPDASFEVLFRQTPQYAVKDDPLLRRDGQWLAELLGLRHDLVQRIPHAGGRDQLEARAMQIALWPGTLGYLMRTLMAPVFSEEQIAATRAFFTRYVSGRGPIPALRIGSQPYGILPTTAFDRAGERGGLYPILNRIDSDWAPLLERVSFVGQRTGDPHQILLDVLGLHPGSVEYHPLQADSLEHKFFELALLNYPVALQLLNLHPAIVPLTLLRSFGYVGDQVPTLLDQVYRARQTPLTGPLVDDRPLSEQDPLRRYAGTRNYIEWLVDAANGGIARIQQEQGFDGGGKPAALLYLLLRHALQLSFHVTGVRLQVAAGVLDDPAPRWREPQFVHVRAVEEHSESRYAELFRADARVTGSESVLLGDYIAGNARAVDPDLREQIEALERLGQVPTARLERVFAEHIDTVGYRLDAWKAGLLTERLDRQRRHAPVTADADAGGGGDGDGSDGEPAGLFLGAFGWLEDLRPAGRKLSPADLPDDLAAKVDRPGDPALMRDSTNQGLIAAPSLNHATTAAVLRNGYLANDGRLAVNLSSRRVQVALEIQEGMRGGQSVGALLGYRFERHVHDNGPLQVRDLIYHLRRAFPLAADQIAATRTDDGEAKESVAAMNVVDGRKLVEHVEKNRQFSYPFGLTTLPRRGPDQETALTNALAHIRDANDALADLVLAEGVHQAVLGNYERCAGTLDAFAKGGYPPEPEVVRTPRTGIGLTLRMAIHLPPGAVANPLPAIPLTPLASAEPALNGWLRPRLPVPADVGCQVTFTDRATGAERTEFVSQADLGLHPIDLVYRADVATQQALTDLDDRILTFTYATFAPRLDREIHLRYADRVTDRYTWFELQGLLRSLRELTIAARPLQPADLMRHNDASSTEQATAVVPRSRVETARDDLRDNHVPALDALAAALANPAVSIDDAIAQYATTVGRLAAYRLPQTGTGFTYEWRAGTYDAVVTKLAQRVQTWNDRLADFDRRLDAYDNNLPAPTPEPDRIALLRAADIVISTRLVTPPPANASDYRLALDGRRAAFVVKRDALRGLVDTARPTLTRLLADAEAELPLTLFDAEPFDVTADAEEVDRFRRSLTDSVHRLKADLTARISAVDSLLGQHDAASATERVRLLQQAAKKFFGDDFQLIPAITLPPAAAAELTKAWQHSTSGELTRHLTDAAGADRDFPVDDWLHGIARVRDKMHHWENAVLIGEAVGAAGTADLTPLQLPYGPGEPWLALEIPDGYAIDSDRLLYTAHFAEPFDSTAPVVGLLVDEWTEVVPGTQETTGIAFHFDRPNAEPPQAWLLALAPREDRTWSWDDLLAVVNYTLDSAKRRAIEPVHIDDTAYSWFLPATMSAFTFPEISISNNLLRNMRIYSRLPEE